MPEYCRYLSEDKEIKKRNYTNTRNENISVEDRGSKKEYMKNYYYKIQNFLNHLINRVEELENFSLKKYSF